MKITSVLIRLKGTRAFRFMKQQEGSALIASLLVLLVLVLLGLALLLQGNTEHLIAVNEQDAQRALMHAEEGVTMAKLVVYTRSNPATGFVNFSNMLKGPNSTGNDGDDHMIGFDLNNDSVSDLNIGLTPSSLDLTNEQTTTVKSGEYEVFRRGIDTDGNGIWDGPRSLVHIKITDNYDESPAANDPLADTDKRIYATIFSEYPIFVDSAGSEDTASRRGVSTRILQVEFEPQTQPAISTEGSLTLDGNVRVCGECGDIHANTDITLLNDPKVCGDATAVQSFSNGTVDNSNVGGNASGGQPTLDIPVINPYDSRWVPKPEWFAIPETGLPSVLVCAAYDRVTNPGGTKYFAFVADGGAGKIFKAYPDPNDFAGGVTNTTMHRRWIWKLIDDLNTGAGVQLDNCGRVKVPDATDAALSANAGMVSVPDVNTIDPTDARSLAVDDGTAISFYGFDLQNPYQQATCSDTDASLSGGTLQGNNWTVNNRSNITPSAIVATSVVLPAGCNFHDDFTTTCQVTDSGGTVTATDTVPDFDPANVNPTDSPSNRGKWRATGNDIWSPLYGAIIFVWGHVDLGGNLTQMRNSGTTIAPPPNNRWRISFMSTGYINVSGTPAYSTAKSDIVPQLFVAGRDVQLAGNANGSIRECGRTAGNYCNISGTVASFAGFIGAHEQINMSGNTSLDGFMIAEDAANCGTMVNSATGISTFNGVPSVMYDCVHPPNPFDTGVKPAAWQEQ